MIWVKILKLGYNNLKLQYESNYEIISKSGMFAEYDGL